jgi:hypothetical protein
VPHQSHLQTKSQHIIQQVINNTAPQTTQKGKKKLPDPTKVHPRREANAVSSSAYIKTSHNISIAVIIWNDIR